MKTAETAATPIKTIDDPRFVKAMAHPVRVRILAMLGEKQASPRELSDLLGTSVGTAAYHVRKLHELGLIELVRETKVRGAVAHFYKARITDKAWAQASPIAKQAAVSCSLQVLGDYVRAAAYRGGFDRAEAHLTRTPMRLDPAGVSGVTAAIVEFLATLEQAELSANARIKHDPHAQPVTDTTVALVFFDSTPLTQAHT